jgi:aspartokinase
LPLKLVNPQLPENCPGNPLAISPASSTLLAMPLPSQPVTLTVKQIAALNKQLSSMRHDINNDLAIIVAAVELIRHKPGSAERMMAPLAEQPSKIADSLRKFSAELERNLGITRC